MISESKMAVGGGASRSRRLLAAMAVLAVAFVVLAAVPAALTDNDAEADTQVNSGETLYVGGTSASDSTGTGEQSKPLASITKALTGSGVKTINLLGNPTDESISVTKEMTIQSDRTTVKDAMYVISAKITASAGLTLKNVEVAPALSATENDSAISVTGGNLTVQDCKITLNGTKNLRAQGIFYGANGTVDVTGTTFVNAKSTNYTRAMYVQGASTVTLTGNTANGLHVFAATGAISSGLTVTGNTSTGMTGDFVLDKKTKDSKFLQIAGTNAGEIKVSGNTVSAASTYSGEIPYVNIHDSTVSVAKMTVDKAVKITGKLTITDAVSVTGGIEIAKLALSGTEPGLALGTSADLTADVTFTAKDQTMTVAQNCKIAGKVTYDDSSAQVKITGGSGGLTVKAGSIDFSGAETTTTGNSITILTGNAVVSANYTLGGDLTVAKGATLTVESGTLSVPTGSKLDVQGTAVVSAGSTLSVQGAATVESGAKLVVEEKTSTTDAATVTIGSDATLEAKSGSSVLVGGSITTDASGKMESDTTITVTSKDAVLPTTIDGKGSVDSSSVVAEGTISGEWNTVTTYTQNQVVTLTGDTVLVEGSQIIMQGKLVIPEGVTLTIEDGAQLVVYSSTGKIENSGTIVIQSAAGAVKSFPETKLNQEGSTGGLIVLYGTIENSGLIQLDYAFSEGTGYAATPQLNVKGKITNNGQIYVGAESYLNLGGEADVTNASSGTVTIEGKVVVYTAKAVSNAGAIVIDGAVGEGAHNLAVALTGTDGYVLIESVKSSGEKAVAIEVSNGFTTTSTTTTYEGEAGVKVTVQPKFTFCGLQVTAGMVKDSTDTAGKTFLRYIDIAGQTSIQADDGAAYTSVPVAIEQTGNAAVSTELALPAGVEMTIKGAMKVTGTMTAVYGAVVTGSNYGGITVDTSASLTVTGKVVANAKDITRTGTVNAAYYSVAASGTASASYVYTTLDQAVSAGAAKIDVLGSVSVSTDVAVPSGTAVTVTGSAVLTVDQDKTLAFASGAVLKNSGAKIDVKGTLYIEVAKTGLKPEGTINSEVVVKGEQDRTYTTLATALELASAGSTVELSGDVTLAADLTIPAGITVDTKGCKIAVPVDRTLAIDGELYLDGSASTVTMGEKDKTKIQNDGKVVLNGTISSTDAIAAKILLGTSQYTVGGAYYTVTVGAETTYYVEPVAVAAEVISLVDNNKLEIRAGSDGLAIGDVSFSEISPDSATVEVYTKLVASSITLDLAKIVFKADSSFDGTITDGVGTVALAGKAMTGFTVASSTSKDVKTLTVSGQFVDTEKTDKFVVSGEVKLNGVDLDKATVSGTAKVSKKSTVDSMTINGTVSVENDVKLTIENDLQVLGTLSAAEKTNDGAAAQVDAGAIYVGITKTNSVRTYTGAAASVSGDVTSAYVLVASGSSIPDSIVKASGVKSTEYFVDGKAYVTVYATGNSYIGLVKTSVENGNFNGWYAGKATTTDVSEKYVGDSGYDKVYAIIDYEIYSLYILADAGIENIAVDGNLVPYMQIGVETAGTTAFTAGYFAAGLKAGSHTISYTLKNGYSGTAKLALVDAGKTTASVSGMAVTVSGDEGSATIQLTGIEKSGYVDPVQPVEKNDDGLKVTDYLLIVLVILVVILAVIVALRLMRS